MEVGGRREETGVSRKRAPQRGIVGAVWGVTRGVSYSHATNMAANTGEFFSVTAAMFVT